MTRDEALKIIHELVKSDNIYKHCLAAEACMGSLWDYFNKKNLVDWGTKVDWQIVGLLHDADYEATNKDLEKHTDEVTEKLTRLNAPKEIIEAIQGHCDKVERKTLIAKSIYACDELSGLIVAAALVRPDKKLAGLTLESVLKRFKEPAFAKGANRDMIASCQSELKIGLDEFIAICLDSMKKISTELGL